MKDYDLIIVGAGPAGSSAASLAAKRGAKTIVLEEHPVIGIPQHCPGRLVATMGSGLTEEVIKSLPTNVVVTELRARRFFAPSGKMIKEVSLAGTGARVIHRSLFDLELARQAANNGAEIVLNTPVRGLLKEQGKIVGVRTSSPSLPEVRGKVVIVAGGFKELAAGIPKQEGLARPGQKVVSGISWELTNVKDVESDIVEFHIGSFTKRGFIHVCPRDQVSIMIETPKARDLDRVKGGNWLISRKIKDAVPLRMTGYSVILGAGRGLPRYIKHGLILAGSAAGFMGILSAVFSGRCAGDVAVEAIKSGNVSEKQLGKYENLVKKMIYGRGQVLKRFYGMSDEEIENILPQMIEKDELTMWDTVPF